MPDRPCGILFDLDGTLYRQEDYPAYFLEMDRVTGARVRELYGAATDEEAFARLELDRVAKGYSSKAEALHRMFGIGLAEMNRWREARTFPEHYVRCDDRLTHTLNQLAAQVPLGLGTNNAPGLTIRLLSALGIDPSVWAFVVTAEEIGAAKPEARFFVHVESRFGLAPHLLWSVGDSEKSDLKPARARGYHTVLVSGMDDVYRLPSLLR